MKIISLSYLGDLRISLKIESERKFEKILKGQKIFLEKIYTPLFIQNNINLNQSNTNLFFLLSQRKLSIFKQNCHNLDQAQNSLIHLNKLSSFKMALSQLLGCSISKNFKYMLQKIFK
jgi:hypothetical protein